MKFSELDAKMRVYEQALDQTIIPGLYMIARNDGRSFTRLTKEIYKFEAPFDIKFTDHMVETTKHLMSCGFNVIYGYTESDEITLLFSKDEECFGRKIKHWGAAQEPQLRNFMQRHCSEGTSAAKLHLKRRIEGRKR